MKRIIYTLLIICFSVMAKGQSYQVLWKNVEAATKKDLPKTEQKILRQIIQKATQEEDYGNLLAAELQYSTSILKVSPDSIDREISLLEQKANRAEASNKVLYALYNLIIGHYYSGFSDLLPNGGDEKAMQYYAKAMLNPDLLAQHKYSEYSPLFEKGKDDAVFNNDLLHVVGMLAGDYKALETYYLAHGNRPAACIAVQKSLEDKTLTKAEMTVLERQYGDLPEFGGIAYKYYEDVVGLQSAKERIEYIDDAMKKWSSWKGIKSFTYLRDELTSPRITMDYASSRGYINSDKNKLVLSLRNLKDLQLTITKTNLTGDMDYLWSVKQAIENYPNCIIKGSAQVVSHTYPEHLDYEEFQDTILLPKLSAGIYILKASSLSGNIASREEFYYVSNITLLAESQPNKDIRYVTVDILTGQPIKGAKVRVYGLNGDSKKINFQTLITDNKGEAVYKRQGNKEIDKVYAYTHTDKALQAKYLNNFFYYDEVKDSSIHCAVFSDRALYRPGQTVHISALVYQNNNRKVSRKVLSGKHITLALNNVNGKKVASKEVTTDDYGTAVADFILPSTGLTGMFSIAVSGEATGHHNIQVEEYKRPTFEVTFDDYQEPYGAGDTIQVIGHAKSYVGMPIANAKLHVKVERTQALWWIGSEDNREIVYESTITTDEEGNFKACLPFIVPQRVQRKINNGNKQYHYSYRYQLSATVTDISGESQEGDKTFYLSNHNTNLTCTTKEKYRTDEVQKVVLNYKNVNGDNVEAQAKYIVVAYEKGDKEPSYEGHYTTVSANKEFLLKIKKSGAYRLHAICGSDTINKDFVVFSLTDTKPAVKTHNWFYLSNNQFPQNGDPVMLQVGSSDSDQHVIYSIFSGNKVIEQGEFDQSNAVMTRSFKYKEEYGNGIILNYAWVKDGNVYAYSEEISRPLPNDTLTLTWKTFRDKLLPGQKETWTLAVKSPQGKASSAQLLALMYDKTLDQIVPFYLQEVQGFDLFIPTVNWETLQLQNFQLSAKQKTAYASPYIYSFAHVSPKYWQNFPVMIDRNNARLESAVLNNEMVVGAAMTRVKKAATVKFAAPVLKRDAATKVEKVNEQNDKQAMANGKMRENLDETAFFYPQLLADKKGRVTINFTLPESLTTWNFIGFAHDKDMNHGITSKEIIAQKELMIQPNMPRFIREGDVANINSKITNLSNKGVHAIAKIELVDPETEKIILSDSKPVMIQAGKSADATFTISSKAIDKMGKQNGTSYNYLIVRTFVEGNGYSDGEQQYLPVLPTKEWVTTTYPLTIDKAGTTTIDLKKLLPAKNLTGGKLTVEYTDNPSWLMIQALPYIRQADENNAFSLVAAYYANSLGKTLLSRSEKLKRNIELWKKEQGDNSSMLSGLQKNQELKALVLSETPWVIEGENEQGQKQSLINFYDENTLDNQQQKFLEQLKKLQNTDGGFAWYPGMSSSVYVTTYTLKTFIRLQHLSGNALTTESAVESMVKKAFVYLDRQVAKEVEEMKENEKKGQKIQYIDDYLCDYLYICALAKRPLTNDISYLLNKLTKNPAYLTIYGKANTAVIASQYGKTSDAKNLLESLSQYAVFTPEMGKYYDTHKAQYSWRSYKIPTEVAAIEAFKLLSPAADDIKGMKRWLLQEKRTQIWNNPLNTLDAIWAFMEGDQTIDQSASKATFLLDGQELEQPKASAGTGYVKFSKPLQRVPNQLTIIKDGNGMSFGGVYMQYLTDSREVKKAGNGILVTREIVSPDGKPIDATTFKVGERITIRLTIEANRDYDFIQVTDRRPACLEPVNQRSGYNRGYYISPKDNATNYYFDRMPKGKHVIETEYFIDREGTYTSGICIVQSAYAPEFSGRAPVMTIKTTK